jgi:hypothetical protein
VDHRWAKAPRLDLVTGLVTGPSVLTLAPPGVTLAGLKWDFANGNRVHPSDAFHLRIFDP